MVTHNYRQSYQQQRLPYRPDHINFFYSPDCEHIGGNAYLMISPTSLN